MYFHECYARMREWVNSRVLCVWRWGKSANRARNILYTHKSQVAFICWNRLLIDFEYFPNEYINRLASVTNDYENELNVQASWPHQRRTFMHTNQVGFESVLFWNHATPSNWKSIVSFVSRQFRIENYAKNWWPFVLSSMTSTTNRKKKQISNQLVRGQNR